VDGIAFHVTGDGYVMSFMTFEGVGVVDGEDFLITVRNDDYLRAFCQTFFGALLLASDGAFGSALRVRNISVHGLGFLGAG